MPVKQDVTPQAEAVKLGFTIGTVPAQAPDVSTKRATNKAIPNLVRIQILRFSE
jgi:hypothetical protein